MLSKIYFYFKDKSESTEGRVFELVKQKQLDASSAPKLFNFTLVCQDLALIVFEILADIFKFAIILSVDSGHGFNTIFRQRELKSCPYSYQSYRYAQKRIRVFSIAGLVSLVAVAVTASLVTNFLFGGKNPGRTASFGWAQTDWLASSTDIATHADNQSGWDKFSTTSDGLKIGGDLQLALSSSTYAKDTPEAFLAAGTLAPGFSVASTTVYAEDIGANNCSRGAATDNGGNFYTTNACMNQIKKYAPSGELLLTVNVDGRPHGVAVDSVGNIYATDYDQAGVKKFASDGSFITQWGSRGEGEGQFSNNAFSIAVDSSDNLYVAGLFERRIQKFDAAGNFILQWGSDGAGDGQNAGIGALAVDDDNNVYVSDWGNKRIQIFSSTGTFISKFGSEGVGDGQFANNMFALGVDNNGYVFVGDNDRVQMFDAGGNFVFKWGVPGSAVGEYAGIYGLGVDGNGNVYTSEDYNSRVQKTSLLTAAYTSEIINLGGKSAPTSAVFTPADTASSGLVATFKAGNTPVPDGTWVAASNIVSGEDLAVLSGRQYLQYQIFYKPAGSTTTPPLDSIDIGYQLYGLVDYASLILDAPDLVSYWQMDNDWLDSKGGGHGTAFGATFAPPIISGSAGRFDGTAWVEVPDSPELNPAGDFSITAWLSLNSYGDTVLLNKGNGIDEVNSSYKILIMDGYPQADYFSGGVVTSLISPQRLDLNRDYHLAITKSGNAVNLFVNGVSVAVGVLSGPINDDNNPFMIGRLRDGLWYFDGKVDELAFYGAGLSENQVNAQFNARRGAVPSHYLTSSWYNAENAEISLTSLGWTEDVTLPAGAYVKFQVKTSADASDGQATSTSFVGPDGTDGSFFTSVGQGCTKDGAGTVLCPINQDINNKISIGDGINDQFVQYKAYLESDGINTPIISGVVLGYISNKRPEFDPTYGAGGVELEEVPAEAGESRGRLVIRYKVRDPDTAAGATPGLVTPSFEYSKDGVDWYGIEPWELKPEDSENKAVEAGDYTLHTANWSAESQISGYVGNLQVRVSVNDNEAVSNIAQVTAAMTADFENPRSNLQAPQQPREFLTHEFRVVENSDSQMLDRVTGGTATGTETTYAGQLDNSTRHRPNLVFNGTSSKVLLPPLLDFSQSRPFSVNAAFKMSYQGGGCRPILSTGGSSYGFYFAICADSQDGENNVVHIVGHGGDYWGSSVISTDDLVRLMVVFDGTAIKVYVNNTLDIDAPFYYPWGQSDPTFWNLGYGEFNDRYFQGQIGYLATWNKAISPYDPNTDAFDARRPLVMPDIEQSKLSLGIIDENAVSYNLSNANYGEPDGLNASSGLWQNTGSSSLRLSIPWVFTENVSRDVYIQAKDIYGNIREDAVSVPYAPTKLDLKDLSNVKDGVYREYISWQVFDGSQLSYYQDFNDYVIYRSTDGTNYSVIGYVDDVNQNYYTDTSVEQGKKYYYRVATMLEIGIESEKSTVVSDKADGQGGTDFTPPAISDVATATVDSTWARIAWKTDELSNSVVEYSSRAADTYASSSQVISMVTDHEVVITNLQPDTEYVFRVKSTDPLNNDAVEDNSPSTFAFKTKNGPVISGVSVVHADNYSAHIAWQTGGNSSGQVVYSQHPDLSNPVVVNEQGERINHEVQLNGLTPGDTYYFEVRSRNNAGNETVDANGGEYYSFITASDFEAPVISLLKAESKTGTEVLIDWRTNEPATSKVYYGSESNNYTSSSSDSADLVANHVVELYGLNTETRYYYVVVSTDGSGNRSTSTEQSFITSEPVVRESDVKEREKAAVTKAKSEMISGITVINKSDTTAPNLDKITVADIQGTSAVINWLSDETADSFVEYGLSDEYGKTIGQFDGVKNHTVNIDGLRSSTQYHFRVAGKDTNGNLAKSADQTFTTAKAGAKNDKVVEEFITGGQDASALTPGTSEEKSKLVSQAIEKAVSLLNQFAGDVTLGTLESTMMTQYDALNKLAIMVPAPVLSAEPAVIVSANSASIQWQTNKEATSFVAYGPASIYDLYKNPSGYNQIVGRPDSFATNHQVVLSGLSPQTVYHYQVKSKAKVGAEAVSRDFTFRTKEESLEVTHFYIERLTPSRATVKWVTNLPSDSELKYIPYRANKLSVEEEKTLKDEHLSTVHEIRIEDFETGVIYQIDLQSADAKGKAASKQIPAFSTTKDDLPPVISQIQTESMISQAKEAKVQTIVTWTTNEPTLSQLSYEKGVVTNDQVILRNKVVIEAGYSRKHTAVITNFDPGTVYSLQITATDSGGNNSKSPIRTIITPRQKETVFDLIVNNFKETFGWVDKIKGIGK